MMTAKHAVIGAVLIVAFVAYYQHTHQPCPMCHNELLIRCEGCKGTGIIKVNRRVVPISTPMGYLGEYRKKLKTPIERTCVTCKGTGKSRCPNCGSRVKFDLNKSNEPIRRYIYTAKGKLIRTEEINPATLPKPKPLPNVKQIKFVQ